MIAKVWGFFFFKEICRNVNYIAEASTIGHGFFSLFTRNRSSLYLQRSLVSYYTPARWRTRIILAWITNYERSCPKMTYIRSGLQERASTSGVLASVPLCRVVEREMVGCLKKKRVRRSPAFFACWNSRARLLRAMVPAYIVSREKEKAREHLVRASKILLISPIEFDNSRDYRSARLIFNFFFCDIH